MSKSIEFMGLTLDGECLHTPAGEMPLDQITRAEFVRETEVAGSGATTEETSLPAVAGGAALGGVIAGPAGAVVGGLLGSTVKEETPGLPRIKTLSAHLVFETGTATYELPVPREQEVAAISFAKRVDGAARRRRG